MQKLKTLGWEISIKRQLFSLMTKLELFYLNPIEHQDTILGATSIARIGEDRLSDELGGGLRSSSKIPNFSLLEYLALPTQRGFKTALRKQIHDIGTDRSNMSRDHSLLRLATIHYSSINNLFNPNSLRVLPWCITRPLYSKIRAMFESVYAVS